MKKLIVVIAILAVLITAFLLYKESVTTSGTWRYKISVNVETPEGLKSGFAVREMSNSRSKMEFNLPQVTHSASVTGEAVVVDLGHRGKLFALLSGYAYGESHKSFVLFETFPSGNGGNSVAGIRYYRDLKNAKATLPPTQYPILVTFKNITDPKTVTPVLEMKRDTSGGNFPIKMKITRDRFEELFGEGVHLKNITIEMTDEPVTWEVSSHLPSFGNETNFWEWRRSLPAGDIRKIGMSNFIRSKD